MEAGETTWSVLAQVKDREQVERDVLPLFPEGRARFLRFAPEEPFEPRPEERVIAFLDDTDLALLWPRATGGGWTVGVLPHPGLLRASASLGVAPDLEEAVREIAADPRPAPIDVLTCNGRVVFESVVVGDTSALAPRVWADANWRERLTHLGKSLSGVLRLQLRPWKLTTKAERVLDTAALGIVVVEHRGASLLTRAYADDSTCDDGQLLALVLAPRSVVSLARYLVRATLRWGKGRTPPFVGVLRTAGLNIEGRGIVEYWIDGARASSERLEILVAPRTLSLLPGSRLERSPHGVATKESVRLAQLPLGEARAELIDAPLPFLPRASTEDFKELYQVLRSQAESSRSFVVLMVLSSLLATLGLFADSAPVIIGAMILAPLMGPIVSLGMGLARQDPKLMPQAARTLSWGLLVAVACAVGLTWITPLETINDEIAARLRPTLLDLGVAVISGVAAAYAHAREEVAKSLAGVAIAVALVPPLAVVGVGLGWASWTVFSGAALLFLTNLAGIVLAAGATFLTLGFAPFRRATRGLALSLVLVGVVGVPLALSFVRMVDAHRIVQQLDGLDVGHGRLEAVRVVADQPLRLRANVLTPVDLSSDAIDSIDAAIEAALGRAVDLELTVLHER